MPRPDVIAEIIATYEKHGWLLRRVLLSESQSARVTERVDVATIASDIDAAWFSRLPNTGAIAWEIRYLDDPAFSLVEHLDENEPDFEAALEAVEQRLREKITGGNISLTTAAPDSKL